MASARVHGGLLLCLLVLTITGCGSLLSIERTDRTPIGIPPKPSFLLQENTSQLADYNSNLIESLLRENPTSELKAGSKSASYLVSYLGKPASTITNPDEITDIAQDSSSLLQDYKYQYNQYQLSLDDKRRSQMGETVRTKVSSGWLSWLLSLGWVGVVLGACVVVFLVPNAALVSLGESLAFLVRTLVTRVFGGVANTVRELVRGIEEAKGEMSEEEKKKLKEKLKKHTSSKSKQLIAKEKADANQNESTKD